ncbi:hypothetical protein BEI60_13805 [Eisenbergiella tayi]|nr:hypothetical protein BEI60_13805 [Eisenbergiella tayi]
MYGGRQKKGVFLTVLSFYSAANAAETPPFGRQTAPLGAGSGIEGQSSKKHLPFFEMPPYIQRACGGTEGGRGPGGNSTEFGSVQGGRLGVCIRDKKGRG